MTPEPPPGDWICTVCGSDNPGVNPVCFCCRVPLDGSEVRVERARPKPKANGDDKSAILIALVIAAVALFFVAPGIAILFVVLSLPLLATFKPGSGASGCLTALAVACGAILAAIGAFFVTCFAILSLPQDRSNARDGWGRIDLALTIGLGAAVVAAIATVWWLVARRGRAKRSADLDRIHAKAQRRRLRHEREAGGGPPSEGTP